MPRPNSKRFTNEYYPITLKTQSSTMETTELIVKTLEAGEEISLLYNICIVW